MSITDSFEEFREMRVLLEELCQEMYNDLNGGEPSNVLKYCFYKETLDYIRSEPADDPIVQRLMEFHITNILLTLRSSLTIETVQVSLN